MLLDYRPALRGGPASANMRTSSPRPSRRRPGRRSADAVHQLLARPAGPALADWPGVTVVDRRVPVRVLNWAWHRRQWPPIERLAGTGRRRPLVHPLLMPTRAATGRDHPRPRFPSSPRAHTAEIRRDYAGLVRAPRAAASLVVVNSGDTARAVQVELRCPATASSLCRPGLPDGSGSRRPGPNRCRATSCSSARSSRARTSARCSTRGPCW